MHIDLVDVFRPSNEIPDLAEETVRIKAKTLWLQLGIFNNKAKKIVESSNINFVENKCTKNEYKKFFEK